MRLLFIGFLFGVLIAGCSDDFEYRSTDEAWPLEEPASAGAPPPDCPDADDPGVHYHSTDAEYCEEIAWGAWGSRPCIDWFDEIDDAESFRNECGCGCIGEPREVIYCDIDGCPEEQYCHYEDGMCGQSGIEGVCRSAPRICTDDLAEVCGCDGQLHSGSSSCAAQHAGVDISPDPTLCEVDTGPPCVDEVTDTIDPDHCFILEQCVEEGARNPVDDCQICDPTRSQLDWTEERGCAPQIASGLFHSCAVDESNQLHCWPDDGPGGRADPPPGTFWQTSVGHFHSCAVDTSDKIQCWGSDHEALTNAPSGDFWDVSASRWYSCGVAYDQHLECWGRDILSHGQSNPPAGNYVKVSASPGYACAVDVNGALRCWGDSSQGLTAPPSGIFVDVSTGDNHACALDVDGQIHCWGNSPGNIPSGNFRQVSAGGNHNCAIDLQGLLHCWGGNDFGQSDPPPGSFRQVSAGVDFSCAFDTSNQIHCWGDEARTDAPDLGQ